MIFTAAADDEMESIVESAFENVEQGREWAIFFFFQLNYIDLFVLFLIFFN